MNPFDEDFATDNRNVESDAYSDGPSFEDADGFEETRPVYEPPRSFPEPIDMSGNGMARQSYIPQMTPQPDFSDAQQPEAPVYQEADVYADVPLPGNAPAVDYAYEEAPAAEETPVISDARTPAERLAEYVDCRFKFIPAGTDVPEFNKKYQYAVQYGKEWGYTTVILPVSQELADALCGDPSAVEAVRAARMLTLERPAHAADPGELDALYAQKTAVIARSGIRVEDFENADARGAAINCFSSFVRGGKTTGDLLLLQVPVSEPWRVFEWIPVGGIAGAPSNELLAAASKLWNGLCGAVPAVLGYGVAEFFVPNGMPDRQTALQIARGQFALCHERVLRLTRSHTLSELADTLTRSCVWYLGWSEN